MASSFGLDVSRLNNEVDKEKDLWYNIITKRKGEKNYEISRCEM